MTDQSAAQGPVYPSLRRFLPKQPGPPLLGAAPAVSVLFQRGGAVLELFDDVDVLGAGVFALAAGDAVGG